MLSSKILDNLETDLESWTTHRKLRHWVQEMVELCQPEKVHLCDGSKTENQQLFDEMVASKMMVKLNPDKRPNSYWCASDPNDVARVEERTFICSEKEDDCGPTNHWVNPKEMKGKMLSLFKDTMKGRTMYVIPFCMGPLGSEIAYKGVQITDSPYVVVSTRIMTRMGTQVIEELGDEGFFVPCMHSVGAPLEEGQKDIEWPCNADNKYIVHFPESREIWSFGSGYGGNALLGKKCFALRIASAMARDEGWLAEHMLILGIENPEGKRKYIAAAFPSACGKTNLAMLQSSLPGWKIECVGDDIAWMKFGADGRLYAINPEAGFFGVAPGTSMKSNPNAMLSMKENSIFTNVALTSDGDVWWEGMTPNPPENLTSWKKQPWSTEKGPSAHPNSRFTAPAKQCPVIDPQWENPKGVPISAILFGGRRAEVVPLVYQSFDWNHGTFLGTIVSSEKTAAASGNIGTLRHDPFAMLPFCGYHMGDYFKHWLEIGKKTTPEKLPKIFYVNWFKKDSNANFLWPGFCENMRVLQWIFERIDNKSEAKTTAIGFIPTKKSLNISDLNLPEKSLDSLLSINNQEWLTEIKKIEEYYQLFEDKLPEGIKIELEKLKKRLSTNS